MIGMYQVIVFDDRNLRRRRHVTYVRASSTSRAKQVAMAAWGGKSALAAPYHPELDGHWSGYLSRVDDENERRGLAPP